MVTYGAGAFNVLNAVAGAYAERSPVVVIAGAPGARERTGGFMLHHQARTIDTQANVFHQVTCDQAVLNNPETAPAEIARVLRSARERSLPVYIEFPRDMVAEQVEPVPVLPRSAADADAVAECAQEILARLARAKSPVIVVDVEIRRYGIEKRITALANKLNVPVVTTFMGRGLLEGSDALLGTYFGPAGAPDVSAVVDRADLALLLGVIPSDTNFALSHRTLAPHNSVLALDRTVRIGHHTYSNVPLDELVAALLKKAKPHGAKKRAVKGVRYARGMPPDARPIMPSDIATAVNDMFDRHAVMPMTSDIGDCLFTAMEIENTALAAPGYYAGMGVGVPAGIGVTAATGRRPLILVGDGAFQMTGWELGNCRRYGLDPIVLLFNNKSWEMLRVFQPESAFNDLDDWHFADIAGSIGGHGVRVATRRELAAALDAAVKRRGVFSLIEVMLPRGVTSKTLERFVKGFKAARERAK
ncbi:MAG: indolepyruvate decarboxylase [Hyphomicrobiales bacterium]